jgi:hypothetical protein
MADVFISYKSDRRNAAQHLARILELNGYTVWYDYGLLSGRDFGPQIEREIRAAKAVIVLWCSLSRESRWVLEEAELAERLGTFTPVWLERVDPPLGFARADTIDLSAWDGAPRSHALDRLLMEVGRQVGRDPVPSFRVLQEYEATWRAFGAPPLSQFALIKPLEEREELRLTVRERGRGSRGKRERKQRKVSEQKEREQEKAERERQEQSEKAQPLSVVGGATNLHVDKIPSRTPHPQEPMQVAETGEQASRKQPLLEWPKVDGPAERAGATHPSGISHRWRLVILLIGSVLTLGGVGVWITRPEWPKWAWLTTAGQLMISGADPLAFAGLQGGPFTPQKISVELRAVGRGFHWSRDESPSVMARSCAERG